MKKLAVVSGAWRAKLGEHGFEFPTFEKAILASEELKGKAYLVFELPKKEGIVTTEVSRNYVALFAFLEGGWKQGWLLPSTVLLICHPVNLREVTRLAVTNEVTFDVLCSLSQLDSVMGKFISSDTVCLQRRQAEIRSA